MVFLNVSPKFKMVQQVIPFFKWNLISERLKRNAHLLVSLRVNDVYSTGLKASSEEFKLPFAKKCLAALKIKTRVCFADLKGRPCFLFLCCHFLIKRRGVKNFLEPTKIRFKRGFFFFTIKLLRKAHKKHRRSHYVFSF